MFLKTDSDTYTSHRAFRVGSQAPPYYYCVSFKQFIHKIATLSRATGEPSTHSIAPINVTDGNFLLVIFKSTNKYSQSYLAKIMLCDFKRCKINFDSANELVANCSPRIITLCYGINMCQYFEQLPNNNRTIILFNAPVSRSQTFLHPLMLKLD